MPHVYNKGHQINKQAHKVLVLIAYISREGSDEPAQMHSLARALLLAHTKRGH